MELPVHQPVLSIEVFGELAEESAGHPNVVVGPSAHRLEVSHVILPFDVGPQGGHGLRFHRWPQHLEAGSHQAGGHAAVTFHEQVRREIPLIEPGPKQASLVEIDRGDDGYKVPDRSIRIQRQVASGEGTAEADSVQVDLRGAGFLQHSVDGPGDDLEDRFFKPKPFIFFGNLAPVEEVDIMALIHQVFDETVAGEQVQHIGTADA